MLIFRALDGQRVKLSAEANQIFEAHIQRGTRREAGGVLLGRWLRGSGDVVVDLATSPMSGDRRGRFSFYRDDRAHQRLIDDAHHQTKGTCGYLGEWHTHPEPDPVPSSVDRRDWSRRLERDVVDVSALFFLIVGTERFRVWRGVRRTGLIESIAQEQQREV